MDKAELRIGNYVLDQGNKILRIDWFERDKVCMRMEVSGQEVHPMTDRFEFLKPIPFTDEWMLKFGAIRDKYNDLFIPHPEGNDLRFYLVNGFIQLTKDHCCPLSNYEHIKYVHLFQNLYFFETGEELCQR